MESSVTDKQVKFGQDQLIIDVRLAEVSALQGTRLKRVYCNTILKEESIMHDKNALLVKISATNARLQCIWLSSNS